MTKEKAKQKTTTKFELIENPDHKVFHVNGVFGNCTTEEGLKVCL